MRQELLESTFITEFDLNKLQNLITKIHGEPLEIETINAELTTVNSFFRLKTSTAEVVVLVLKVETKLEWNFKLRKLISDYLAEHELKQAFVALSTTQGESWYLSLVQRRDWSPYLLNCYSIPVGPTTSKTSLAKVEQMLKKEDLKELTEEFGLELKQRFMSECRRCYELLLEDLNLLFTSTSGPEVENDRVELGQKLIIKLLLLYLLEQKNLLEIKFRSLAKTSCQQKLISLAQTEVLDHLLAEKQELVLPSTLRSLKELWTTVESYNFSWGEDEPWAKFWALSPAVLADLNENLLTTDQRKSNGVFYTPEAVVHYMGQQTIINYLTTNVTDLSYRQAENLVYEQDLEQIEISLLPQIYQNLKEIKVCDPAVGSGAFALGIAKELVRIKEIVTTLIADQVQPVVLRVNTIKTAVHCLDIDEQAVEITKIRLWLWTEVDKVMPVTDIEDKILTVNPLYKVERNLKHQIPALKAAKNNYQQQLSLEEKKIAKRKFQETKEEKLGEKFSLVDYFPEVWAQGGFDVVISNPPYVGEKGNKEIFREVRKYSLGRFYSGKMDLFYFFFHLGLDLAAEEGSIALITTNYFLTATGAYQLREDLEQRGQIKKLINFNNLRLFPAAIGQHNLITILQKNSEQEPTAGAKTVVTAREGDADRQTLLKILAGEDEESNYYTVPLEKLYQGSEKYLRLEVGKIDNLLASMTEVGQALGELGQVNQGIVSGCDRVSKRHIKKYNLPTVVKGTGIFVLTAEEVNNLDLTSQQEQLLRPWFKNSDIEAYWSRCKDKGEYILYLKGTLGELPTAIAEHLQPFRAILESRREVAAGRIRWWELQWPRSKEIFEGPKLVVPQRSQTNTFAYNERPWYASADVYYITQVQPKVDLKYILALLNSTLYYLWFYYKGKKKGNLLELYQKQLTEVPIKVIPLRQQQIFVDLVDKLQSKKEKLKQYQAIKFIEIKNKQELTTITTLKDIVEQSEQFEVHYQGQAKIVRQIEVGLEGEILEVYSAKSNQGYYKLFDFLLTNSELRDYLKFYLENATAKQLQELNQINEKSLVNRVLAIEITGYQELDKVQAVVDDWKRIKEKEEQLKETISQLKTEIDELVYQLYDFSSQEIDFLIKKANELKNN